ncbi:MAG: hypothetical protein MUC69_08540, partial [Gemmatimonadales bacterium]|nr:hypothetical protein [Gemmatimonadales bacterium]
MAPGGGGWTAAGEALLAARGLSALPPADARALLALLHVGTLVELDDVSATAALDLGRLADARALGAADLDPAGADVAAARLLALGHRDPAQVRVASGQAGPGLRRAWHAWVGDGDPDGSAVERWATAGLELSPAAWRGALDLRVDAAGPRRVALRRLRVGRTTLDLSLRRAPGRWAVGCRVAHGPPVELRVAFPPAVRSVLSDDVELAGPEVR